MSGRERKGREGKDERESVCVCVIYYIHDDIK